MRDLALLNCFRITGDRPRQMFGNDGDGFRGYFEVASKIDNAVLRIIATATDGWDHVSVSRRNRCPNWAEMEQVKHMFFEGNETAMQLHVPAEDHVNMHPTCLHLWRPHAVEIPRPPAEMVGVRVV